MHRVHRGDVHQILIEALAAGTIEFSKQMTELDQKGSVVRLGFEDGSWEEADIVIGADGINSRAREILLGPELPKYTVPPRVPTEPLQAPCGALQHPCNLPVGRYSVPAGSL